MIFSIRWFEHQSSQGLKVSLKMCVKTWLSGSGFTTQAGHMRSTSRANGTPWGA